jgi:hypothetical protein
VTDRRNVTLSGILGIPWLSSNDGVSIHDGPVSELDDAFSFSLSTTSQELRERPDMCVMTMLQFILFGMNWSEYASDSEMLKTLLRSGYGYNYWPEPTTLRV